MFQQKTYTERRKELKEKVGKGLILLFGNDESPMNYTDNTYHFRQDSTFLYYFGIQRPGLAAVMDTETGHEIIFGDEYTVEDFVWRGPQPTISGEAEKVGVSRVQPAAHLSQILDAAKQRKQPVHFLPLYRPENKIRLQEMTGISPREVTAQFSVDLVKAVVSQREFKSAEEIAEELSLSINTVYTYRNRILEKMSLKSNVELTQYVLRNKLVEI